MNTTEINKHLTEILTKIFKNPLIFVSEADVHKLVMNELMKIDELNPDNLVDTACTIGSSGNGVSSEKYKTMLMHSEYGHQNLPKARSDIVILNKKDVAEIDNPLDLNKKENEGENRWLTPDYIFEFGTEKSANSIKVFKTHLKNDLKKISKSKKMGYIIHIQRNYYVSEGKRQENNIAKYEEYAKAFMGEIKDYSKDKIKIVIAIIDVGGTVRKVYGKVRLITNPFGSNPKFERIGLDSVQTEISKLLK
ncbi:MAG: hypothetical protein PF551_05405 [Candidatus Marinimicrobia bacterium]|jgi:hypothetical protein|nr:hypothetical protein [Candidatus Neomarinimicrobiota bacterium]